MNHGYHEDSRDPGRPGDDGELVREFEPDGVYMVEGRFLAHVARVAKRLYTEQRLKNGDEYRDLAQALQGAVDGACPYEEADDDRENPTR